MCDANSWLLDHDNVPSHNTQVIGEFLAEKTIVVLEQLPHSSDQAPCDFLSSSSSRGSSGGPVFYDVYDIKKGATTELKSISGKAF